MPHVKQRTQFTETITQPDNTSWRCRFYRRTRTKSALRSHGAELRLYSFFHVCANVTAFANIIRCSNNSRLFLVSAAENKNNGERLIVDAWRVNNIIKCSIRTRNRMFIWPIIVWNSDRGAEFAFPTQINMKRMYAQAPEFRRYCALFVELLSVYSSFGSCSICLAFAISFSACSAL